MFALEKIKAYGHELVLSTHKTTFEITKEKQLTSRGNCIIVVNANKAVLDLNWRFKEFAKRSDAIITITIEAGAEKEIIVAKGHPKLTFMHPKDLVVRKSSFVCDRTLGIKADKAARNFSKNLIEKLRDPKQLVRITLTVRV
jgi:hypothetical protein